VLVGPGLAVAVPVGKGLKVTVGKGLKVPVGLPIPVADPVGVDVPELVAVGEAEHEGEAVAVAVAVALWVGVQLDVAATAAPPSGPVNATTATETSKVAVPVARPASPTLCSFSQTLFRDSRKVVTIPTITAITGEHLH
jgi:hypothetical protein